MLIAMVTIFVCCWLPLNTVHILTEYWHDFHRQPYADMIFFITHIIAMSSTIYNPFLYAGMNDKFQTEFRAAVPWPKRMECWKSRRQSTTQSNNYTAIDNTTRMSQCPLSPTTTLLSPLENDVTMEMKPIDESCEKIIIPTENEKSRLGDVENCLGNTDDCLRLAATEKPQYHQRNSDCGAATAVDNDRIGGDGGDTKEYVKQSNSTATCNSGSETGSLEPIMQEVRV